MNRNQGNDLVNASGCVPRYSPDSSGSSQPFTTKVAQGADRQFAAAGIDRKQWSSAATIRKIFKAAFKRAGLPYFNPHSFRKTLVQLAFKLNPTTEQFKAWSQNLGHEDVLTTFTSYGVVAPHRQAEIMRALNAPQSPAVSKDMVEQIADAVSRRIGAQAGDRPPGDG
jgi:integrase/recombinase XerD